MSNTSPLHLRWLDPRDRSLSFPPVDLALHEPNGLLAIGGDLNVSRLLNAYRQGIFPWFNPDEPILWWCPDPRTVFKPGQIRVTRSLRRSLNRRDYAVTADQAFPAVIRACAERGDGGGTTWLGAGMIEAYIELYRRGYAHSIEVWRHGELIGGLYGVALGRVFFGESMFSRASDASKIAFVHLAEQLASWGFELIDGQVGSPHLYSLGAFDMPRSAFSRLLKDAIPESLSTGSWRLSIDHPDDGIHRRGP